MLVTISINTILFIVMSIGLAVFNEVVLPHSLYLIIVVITCMQQYFIGKEINIINDNVTVFLEVMVPTIVTVAIGGGFLLDKIYVILILYSLIAYCIGYFFESSNIDYEQYKTIFNAAIVVVIAFSSIGIIWNERLPNMLVTYYILFFLTMIISLRESRAFSFNMVNTNSKKANTMLASISVVVFLISVSDKLNKVVIGILGFLKDIIAMIVMKISIILTTPLMYLYNYIIGLEMEKEKLENVVADIDKYKENLELTEKINTFEGSAVKVVAIIIVTIIVLIIVWNILKALKDSVVKNSNDGVVFHEERESLKVEKDKEKFNMIFKSKEHTLQEKICYIFRKFQKLTKKKGIFKNYMTATQVSNISKIYVESTDELNVISKLYNEAKFSNHIMDEDDLLKIKSSLKIINKEYKVK